MTDEPRKKFDTQMMGVALGLAQRGLGTTWPNPAVGAVIADESSTEIIARGWTRPGGRPHAETEALVRAGERARSATMYVTLEPCTMCVGAMVHARVGRLVYGAAEPKTRAIESAQRLFETGKFNHQPRIESGILADECSALLTRFFENKRVTKKSV